VVDENDLLRAEQALGDGERADRIVGYGAAGVPDHMCVALLEGQRAVHVEPRVHASDDGNLLPRRGWKVALVKRRRVDLVFAISSSFVVIKLPLLECAAQRGCATSSLV
jgi:hypothetical protein